MNTRDNIHKHMHSDLQTSHTRVVHAWAIRVGIPQSRTGRRPTAVCATLPSGAAARSGQAQPELTPASASAAVRARALAQVAAPDRACVHMVPHMVLHQL